MIYATPQITTADQAAWYLAALIDGEGYVSKPGRQPVVGITNTEKFLINTACAAYDLLGITYTVYTRVRSVHGWKQAYDVRVFGVPKLKLILKLIPIHHPGKRKNLDYHVEHDGYYNTAAGKLEKLGYDPRKSLGEYASILGVSTATVARAARKIGWPIRTYSEASRVYWANKKSKTQLDVNFCLMKQLYLDEKLSSTAVGLRMGMSAAKVSYWLRKFGVKLRSRREGALRTWLDRKNAENTSAEAANNETPPIT
jgi:hypothetical protein